MPPAELEAEARSVASRLVPGSGEVHVELLGDGLVNASYKIERDGQSYALRLRTGAHAQLGSDHFWEARVLGVAEHAGLTPPILCCDPQCGVLLSRWSIGRPLKNVSAPGKLKMIAGLIRSIHALPIPPAPRVMTPRAWCDMYRSGAEAQMDSNGGKMRLPVVLRDAAERRLQHLEPLLAERGVLCHSDLHRHNLLIERRAPVLLDWEYAHVGDAWWDLASWSCNNDFVAAACRDLLEHYLGREVDAAQLARFDSMRWLYDYTCLLWMQAYCAIHVEIARKVRARSCLLAARLAGD